MNESELINHLRASGQAQVSPDVSEKFQPILLAEFDRVTAAAPRRSRGAERVFLLFSPRPMFAAALATIILAFGLGTSAIANAAKPGDTLFGWDQATEKVRLALTLGEDNKAKYEADVAEERVAEKIELESQQSEHATEAAELTNRALEQALTTVTRVRTKLEGKKGKGADALTKVEIRLRTLQGEHSKKLKIETKTKNGVTRINVEYGRARWEWTSTATTSLDLLIEIVGKTGLPIDDVRGLLNGANGSDDDAINRNTNSEDETDENRNTNSSRVTNQSGSTTNANRNSNRNTNSGTNVNRVRDDSADAPDDSDNRNVSNTNVSDDDVTTTSDDDVQSIRVRVDLEKGETDIMVETNGVEEEWDIATTAIQDILASISGRTGLSSEAITNIWDYVQE